jgi:hypothetical protein
VTSGVRGADRTYWGCGIATRSLPQKGPLAAWVSPGKMRVIQSVSPARYGRAAAFFPSEDFYVSACLLADFVTSVSAFLS